MKTFLAAGDGQRVVLRLGMLVAGGDPGVPRVAVFGRPARQRSSVGSAGHGCSTLVRTHPWGLVPVAMVAKAASRSSMSISAMFETTPSNASPSHQSVVVASPWRQSTPSTGGAWSSIVEDRATAVTVAQRSAINALSV